MQQSLPNGFDRWLARSSDLELARALTEERASFRPEALAALEEEAARRDLDAAEASRMVRAARLRAGQGRRMRFLLGGLLLAGIGVVPGLIPRLLEVRFALFLDNPGDEAVEVLVEGRRIVVQPRRCREVRMTIHRSEAALLGWLRDLSASEGEAGQELLVRAGVRGSGITREMNLRIRRNGRYLLSLEPYSSYALWEQTYRIDGRLALPEGPPHKAPLVTKGTLIDLDELVFPGRGSVRLDLVAGPFPKRLLLEDETRREGTIRYYRLAREE